MFAYSGSLKEVPEGLFDPLTDLMDATGAFWGCHSLEKLPNKLFTNCPHVQNVDYTFMGSKLLKIPDDIFDGLDELIYARRTFKYAPISYIPDEIFSNKTRLMDLRECFFECKQLESIPPTLLEGCSNLRRVDSMFARCMSDKLISVPEGLFDDCVNLKSVTNVFFMCRNLKNIPNNLFRNCKNVENTNIIINSSDALIDTEWLNVLISVEDNNIAGLNIKGCKCDYTIDWGDGYIEHNSNLHIYSIGGEYILRIKGFIVADKQSTIDQSALFNDAPIKKAIVYGSGFITNMGLFRGCDKLEEIDPNFFAYSTDLTDIQYMFSGCKKLTTIPEGLFDSLQKLEDVSYLFHNCKNLVKLSSNMFAKCRRIKNMEGAFSYTGVEEIPEGLLNGLDYLENASKMFEHS